LKLNVAIFLENVILNFSYKENVFLSNATSNNKNLQKKRVALKIRIDFNFLYKVKPIKFFDKNEIKICMNKNLV